jgi:cell division FtsZ-interacting protein ZapD
MTQPVVGVCYCDRQKLILTNLKKENSMEIEQLIQQIFASTTNQIAATVIAFLTLLALLGIFTPANVKIKNFAKQSPAILATVGIFFSFWGISIGLIALDLTDIQGSIPKLLDGLKIKFIASLMGIGASILVRIAQNFAAEEFDESDGDEKIINLLSDIHKSLATKEVNNTETLFLELKNALVEIDKNNEKRSHLLNESLTSNFDNLSQAFKSFANEVAKNNTDGFIKALEEAMKKFNNNTTEQFGENFKELNRAVGAMLEWQNNYKSHVEKLTDNFESACNNVDSIQSAFSDIQNRAETIVNSPLELNDVLEKIDLRLEELNEYLRNSKQEDTLTSLEKFEDFTAKSASDIEGSTQANSTVVTEPASFWTVLAGILGVMYLSYLIVGKVISWLFG